MGKFASRKFLVAVAAFVTGLGMILNGNTDAETISGTVLALASMITYIVGEASVDAAALKASAGSAPATEVEPK